MAGKAERKKAGEREKSLGSEGWLFSGYLGKAPEARGEGALVPRWRAGLLRTGQKSTRSLLSVETPPCPWAPDPGKRC